MLDPHCFAGTTRLYETSNIVRDGDKGDGQGQIQKNPE